MGKKNDEKKSASKTQDELNAIIDDLARRTLVWAKNNGCFRDKEDGQINGYFVINKQRSLKTTKPVWTQAFDETREIWPRVLLRMLQLGFPICVDSFQGHYIGVDGEQGVRVGTAFNHLYSRANTIREMVEVFIDAHVWNMAVPHMQKRLADGLKDADPIKMLDALDQLYLAAGMPRQMSISQYLLAMGNEDDGG